MPRGVYERTTYRGVQVKRHISKVRTEAILVRWESVRKEVEEWLKPFYDLPIERAMFYLEDLRKICEQAGHVMNERISGDKARMKCAGPRCGKNLEGTNPSGRPKWLAKKDLRDAKNPEIIRSLYFCSEICHNQWVHAQQGAGGTDGR
jgi:hypothetical protein